MRPRWLPPKRPQAPPAVDLSAELLIRVDALGEAITASTGAAERQTDVLADLAEVVRAALNRDHEA